MPESRELPKYNCHKQVWALKIKSATVYDSDGNGELVFEDEGFAAMDVDGDYFRKHNPKAGGYYVQYKGGYKSYSPAEAFEDGYTLVI